MKKLSIYLDFIPLNNINNLISEDFTVMKIFNTIYLFTIIAQTTKQNISS